jgi:hypothetical protein
MRKTVKKLAVRRETVRHLDSDALKDVNGGDWVSGTVTTCKSNCTGTTPCCAPTPDPTPISGAGPGG